jgi:hypothetical protein
MRKLKLPLLLSLISLVWLAGCSSDDDAKPQNTITLDGQPFKITSASLIGVSIDGEGHAGISFTNVSSTKSKILSIDFEYSPNEPISGTYSYPQGSDRYLDDILTYYTEIEGSSFNDTDLEEGTVTIVENGGSNYTVTINLTMLDGKVFSGTYKGKFVVAFNNG